MFKIVCKTPLFTKNSTTSWISCITGTFYVIPTWTPLLNTICQIREKREEEHSFEGSAH